MRYVNKMLNESYTPLCKTMSSASCCGGRASFEAGPAGAGVRALPFVFETGTLEILYWIRIYPFSLRLNVAAAVVGTSPHHDVPTTRPLRLWAHSTVLCGPTHQERLSTDDLRSCTRNFLVLRRVSSENFIPPLKKQGLTHDILTCASFRLICPSV